MALLQIGSIAIKPTQLYQIVRIGSVYCCDRKCVKLKVLPGDRVVVGHERHTGGPIVSHKLTLLLNHHGEELKLATY